MERSTTSTIASDTATVTTTPPPPPKQTALELFSQLCLEFVDALASVWHEDPVVQKVKLKLSVAIGDLNVLGNTQEQKVELITSWHEAMAPHYEAVNKKNPIIFSRIEQASKSLREIGINTKYSDPTIDEDTRECIWEYIQGLCKYSQLYFVYEGIPVNMMTKLTSIASKLTEDIESGKTNGLQNFDIMGLGKEVADSLDPSDLEDFTSSMMSNMGSVTSLASSVIGDSQENSPLGGLNLGGLSSMMGIFSKIMPK